MFSSAIAASDKFSAGEISQWLVLSYIDIVLSLNPPPPFPLPYPTTPQVPYPHTCVPSMPPAIHPTEMYM